ncbi:Quinol monooxygenase YgiN [Polaribacter sp. KT25b]|uniref:putative quinol monooxygenase n=1 Tax=Polaribacter sp. KT25b TaxID=1855336 RepID=UPI00087A89F1|nr:putative quinol monooxygenase [Polaribacter sp. KT25b]SDS12446.1 Quinol monooxygenase YgiN [Polaribacter sp. KT25b]
MKKTIIAHFNVKEAKTTAFLKITKALVKDSNTEIGCITYRFFKEIDRENNYVIYEKYDNESAIEIHNNSKHFQRFIEAVPALLTKEPIIEIF